MAALFERAQKEIVSISKGRKKKKMENITLGQISNWITLVIGLGVGIVTIYRSLKKLILKTLENEFADINIH